MVRPLQSLYPFFKAPLTSSLLRFLTELLTHNENYVLFGLNVTQDPSDVNQVIVTPGLCIMQGVLIRIQQEVVLSKTIGEVCVRFEYADTIPPPAAVIGIYPSGTADTDPVRYLRLATITPDGIDYNRRKSFPILYCAPDTIPPDPLQSQLRHWLAYDPRSASTAPKLYKLSLIHISEPTRPY